METSVSFRVRYEYEFFSILIRDGMKVICSPLSKPYTVASMFTE